MLEISEGNLNAYTALEGGSYRRGAQGDLSLDPGEAHASGECGQMESKRYEKGFEIPFESC